jgi:hypothetical protein
MVNTINVNGSQVPAQHVMLTFAKSSLSILSAGMLIRNVNLKKIKASLKANGIELKSNTVNECLIEVKSMLNTMRR